MNKLRFFPHDRAPQAADPKGGLETSWAITLAELETRGFADLNRIARALKHGDGPVPRAVRDFLAEVLLGERKRPKGRPKLDLLDKRILGPAIESMYAWELKRAQEAKEAGELEGAPADVAVERVAQEVGMSASSVRDALGRRNG